MVRKWKESYKLNGVEPLNTNKRCHPDMENTNTQSSFFYTVIVCLTVPSTSLDLLSAIKCNPLSLVLD